MASSKEEELIRRSYELRKFFRTTVSNRNMFTRFADDVDVEANKIRTTIQTLEHKLERWKEISVMYRSLASPIHAMPPEILSLIFGFTCEENELSRSSLPQAVITSMVCGHWRGIAHSTPGLWSSIYIDFGKWTEDFHVLDELTGKFMERSQTSLLDLSLTLPPENFDHGSRKAGAIPTINLLVANSERWRSLDLSIARRFFPIRLLQPIRGCLPALASLTLYEALIIGAEPTDPWTFNNLDLFEDCPSLSTLEIVPHLFELGMLNIPWLQIQTLRIGPSYSIGGLSLLARCSQVQNIELNSVGGLGRNERDYPGHIIQPVASSVLIDAEADVEVNDFFRHTTLPKLSSLKIQCGDSDTAKWTTWASQSHIQHFLDRSACVITSLSLISLPITDIQALDLLQMISALESLTIIERPKETSNRIITKTFLTALVRPTTSLMSTTIPPILPRLTHLKMGVHLTGLDILSLNRVLTARWAPDLVAQTDHDVVSCLRSVDIVVQTAEGDNNTSLDCLRCFKDAGMGLRIAYTVD